jgi:hypothetical protein
MNSMTLQIGDLVVTRLSTYVVVEHEPFDAYCSVVGFNYVGNNCRWLGIRLPAHRSSEWKVNR